MFDVVAGMSDRDLEQLVNVAGRERLVRMERSRIVDSAKDCGSAPIRGVEAMKLADVNVRAGSGEPSCDMAGTAAQTRSFAPPRSIGWAVKQLQNGARVTRRGWNGPRQWLALQVPDGGSFMTLPYVYIRTVQGDRVPWLASQTDLLACDWQLAP